MSKNPLHSTEPLPIIKVDALNELAKKQGSGKFTLCAGDIMFMGEGSGPYEMGNDRDPQRRAEITDGFLHIVGTFDTLQEAEEVGEEALKWFDAYVVPESAKMRFY